uniref:Putative secreted protein n=1 Tax=Anopheles marajoara TaxID=58244 RepID=A0A2M4CAX4_9DIPT
MGFSLWLLYGASLYHITLVGSRSCSVCLSCCLETLEHRLCVAPNSLIRMLRAPRGGMMMMCPFVDLFRSLVHFCIGWLVWCVVA